MGEQEVKEVKEFVRKESGNRQEKADPKPSGLLMGVLIAVVLLVALCGVIWLQLPPVLVIAVVVLEELLAVCLRHTPIWLHVLVVAGNVVLGIVFGMTAFMCLASLVYLAEIITAHYKQEE